MKYNILYPATDVNMVYDTRLTTPPNPQTCFRILKKFNTCLISKVNIIHHHDATKTAVKCDLELEVLRGCCLAG